MMRWRIVASSLGGVGALWASLGCGGAEHVEVKSAASARNADAESRQDTSYCEFKGRNDREVSESVGTGALQPSIRRVYRIVGEGDQRRRVLVCREVDTNLDSVKDLVRRYTDQGEALEEQADSDYDGTLDTWIRFSKGRIAQVEVDLNRDGKPEETRYYLRGKLSRVQRDSNADGKPDVWEIYAGGHLERMGVDVDFDGRVDRWNRDEIAARESARASEKPESGNGASEGGASGGGGEASEAAEGSAGAAHAGEAP
jgi:hypothetical protein